MTETTLTTIEKTVRIEAPRETVWALWTEPELLKTWFAKDPQIDLQPGGTFRASPNDGPVMIAEFVEIEPPSRLLFTFGWEVNAPGTPLAPGSSRVEVSLVPDGDATLVTLRHFDMPTTHAADHLKGWTLFLAERLPAAAGAVTV